MKNLNYLTKKSSADNRNASTGQNQSRGFLHEDKTELRIPANRQESGTEYGLLSVRLHDIRKTFDKRVDCCDGDKNKATS